MRKSLAEAYEIPHLCPLCMYIGTEEDVIDHLEKDHTDEEMIDATGWDIADFDADFEEDKQ